MFDELTCAYAGRALVCDVLSRTVLPGTKVNREGRAHKPQKTGFLMVFFDRFYALPGGQKCQAGLEGSREFFVLIKAE